MGEQEQMMDDLLDLDLEILDAVKALHDGNWDSENLKQQIGDLLNIRDGMVEKLKSSGTRDSPCDCGDDHHSG